MHLSPMCHRCIASRTVQEPVTVSSPPRHGRGPETGTKLYRQAREVARPWISADFSGLRQRLATEHGEHPPRTTGVKRSNKRQFRYLIQFAGDMADSLFSVADQVVLVSGGSRGIGSALAEGFAQRDARVIIAGREHATLEQTAKSISASRYPISTIVCDVADPEQVTRTVAKVLADYGRVDTLLNVAGVNKRMRVENYSMAEYDWIIGINQRGAFAVAQAVGRAMIGRNSGNIINIDSLNTYAPLKGVTAYAMSKGAISMMTRGMATEWGPHGIRVNAIAPGFFPTALSKTLWAESHMQEWANTATPLGKLGDVKDLVGTAIFLASSASAFITGQVIRVDGGITAGMNWPIEL